MKTKYQVQTGGKLYLAGEYAVLTPGYGAVIQFIPIYQLPFKKLTLTSLSQISLVTRWI